MKSTEHKNPPQLTYTFNIFYMRSDQSTSSNKKGRAPQIGTEKHQE